MLRKKDFIAQELFCGKIDKHFLGFSKIPISN